MWQPSYYGRLNKNITLSSLQTPDGIIKKKHWKAVIDIESKNFYNLKVAYKLTADHIDPKYYQKMNVPMAFYVSFHANFQLLVTYY